MTYEGVENVSGELPFHFRHLRSVGRFANDHAVVQLYHRLQVAEEQETTQVDLQADHVARQFGKRQHLDTVQHVGVVGGNVPPVHSGIDRYLDGAAGSRRVLQQVDRRASSLVEDVIRSPLTQHNFHRVSPLGAASAGCAWVAFVEARYAPL